MRDIQQILLDHVATTEEALKAFDQLDAVTTDFLIGRWRGFEITTGHIADGSLQRTNWYGKVFKDTENIYPLVYYTQDKKGLFAGDPQQIVGKVSADFSQEEIAKAIRSAKTVDSKARIRVVEHRGVNSAAMIYDELAIIDIFRKVDDNCVLGVMDFKSNPDPYFFVLERDNDAFNIEF